MAFDIAELVNLCRIRRDRYVDWSEQDPDAQTSNQIAVSELDWLVSQVEDLLNRNREI